MLVLRGQWLRARAVLADDELRFPVVDEGAWWLSRVRGHNWRYRTAAPIAQGALGDAPSEIPSGAFALDEDQWISTSQRWDKLRRVPDADDDPSVQTDPAFDDDPWINGAQRGWPRLPFVALDDDDGVGLLGYTVDDDAYIPFRHRNPTARLFYPARRGGSTDNSQTYIFDDDPWRAYSQKLYAYAKPLADDEVLPQSVSSFGLDDEPAFTSRHRVASLRRFYPARRGGSTDNSDPITPLGVEDDDWQPARQRLWKLAKAFTDDEAYVNTCSEDYLWYAVQSIWFTPLVAATDDEIIPTTDSLGIEDESPWYMAPTERWKFARPIRDEQIIFGIEIPPIEPPDTGQVQQAEQFSGGYFEHPRRRRTPEQLRKDRERLGIIEAAAEVIDQVAFRQAENPGLDSIQQADELRGELAAVGLPLESAYLELLPQLRADYEAGRKKGDAARAAEELDIVFVMTMLSELDDLDD